MPTPAPDYIKDHEKILAVYGFWPDFHNAPARLTRSGADRIAIELGPIRLGRAPTANDHPYARFRVIFSFSGVTASDMGAFGADNIIDNLTFSTSEYVHQNGTFIVDLESSMGCGMGGHLRAKHGEVIAVEDVSKAIAAN